MLDVLNSVGLGNKLLRMIDRRQTGDKWLVYGGMVSCCPVTSPARTCARHQLMTLGACGGRCCPAATKLLHVHLLQYLCVQLIELVSPVSPLSQGSLTLYLACTARPTANPVLAEQLFAIPVEF